MPSPPRSPGPVLLPYKPATSGRREIGLSEIGAYPKVRACFTPGAGPSDSLSVQTDVATGDEHNPTPYINVRGAEVLWATSVVPEHRRVRFHGSRATDFPRTRWTEIICYTKSAPGPGGKVGAYWLHPNGHLAQVFPLPEVLVGFVGTKVVGYRFPFPRP